MKIEEKKTGAWPRNATRPWRHVALLAVMLLSITVLYSSVTQAYFCANDDFKALHRAAFEDSKWPEHIFTTLELGTFKYRPLSRGLDLLTYRSGGGTALAFRIRGLLFHELNVVLLYALGLLLGIPTRAAAAAALLFGIHPLANQSVVGAVWTVTVSHSVFLGMLVLFVLYTCGRQALVACAFALLACASLLFYEVNIVVFGVLYAYLFGVHSIRRGSVDKRALFLLSVALFASVGLYTGLRLTFVPVDYHRTVAGIPAPEKIIIAAPSTIIKSVITDAGALLCPLDPVLASSLGLPLPSDAEFRSFLPVVGTLACMVVAALAILIWKLIRARRSRPWWFWNTELFLGFTALVPLLPVLVFSGHASETYLYLTVAFSMLLVASIAFEVSGSQRGSGAMRLYVICVAALAVLYGTATFIRNQRVVACGNISRRILSSVQFAKFKAGDKLLFTEVPGGLPSRHYGFYGFTGLDTIRSYSPNTLSYALQLASHNEQISDEPPAVTTCSVCAAHFWVRSDGAVSETPPGGHP